jgi:hypothetical protein
MADSPGDFDSVLDNFEKSGWGGGDGGDAAAALDEFIDLAPEEQEKKLEELDGRPRLPQMHPDLAIIASATVVGAVAPPVPKALNRGSRTVLLRIFGEHAQNGVVDQQRMR